MSDKCVHTEHCCVRHGCKYGNEDCPVVNGTKRQSYECEMCEYEREGVSPWVKAQIESDVLRRAADKLDQTDSVSRAYAQWLRSQAYQVEKGAKL